MSHLLYLNSCDNYPNKCPHICLHLLVKQHPTPQGAQITREDLPQPGSVLYRSPPQRQLIIHNRHLISSLELDSRVRPKLLKLQEFRARHVDLWGTSELEGRRTIRIALWMSKNFKAQLNKQEFRGAKTGFTQA